MIIITGSAVIHPAHFAEALALGVEHSARSRGDPCCVTPSCLVDARVTNRIVFVEEPTDLAGAKLTHAVCGLV